MSAVWRAELMKLAAQWRLRVLLVAMAVGPFGFLLALRRQSQLPVDTLFGSTVLDSGFAAPLVVLGFAATWLLPFLGAVVAGETFAAEDEHGTWSMLLTRGRSRASVFLGKVAAAASVTLLLLVTLALSSVLAGLLLVGHQPLVDLSGVVVPGGRALLLVLASWASVLPGTACFLALAVLLSIATRSAWVGVVVPVLLGLLLVVLALLGQGGAAGALLPTSTLNSWHGLLSAGEPHRFAALGQGALLGVGLTAVLLAGGWVVLCRRDVTGWHQ